MTPSEQLLMAENARSLLRNQRVSIICIASGSYQQAGHHQRERTRFLYSFF
jgi:hypothetical protein